MKIVALVAAALVSLVGCGSFDEAPSAANEESDTSEARTRGGRAADEPTHEHWSGSLARTTAVDFGGGGDTTYCSYQMSFEDVNVEIATTGGKATGATVTARAIEDASRSCAYAPTPATMHTYTSDDITVDASGSTTIRLVAATTNKTKAALVIEGYFDRGRSVVSLRWHRVDQVAPLDWTVDAYVTQND